MKKQSFLLNVESQRLKFQAERLNDEDKRFEKQSFLLSVETQRLKFQVKRLNGEDKTVKPNPKKIIVDILSVLKFP